MRPTVPPLAILLSSLVVAQAARADTDLQPGLTYRAVLTAEGRQLPLPPGDWRLVARKSFGDPGAEVVSLVLMRLSGRTVDAAVLAQLHRSAQGPTGERPRWEAPSGCNRAENPFSRVAHQSDHDLSCAYIARVAGTEQSVTHPVDPAWGAALREAVDLGWKLPPHWLMASIRIADPRDAQHLRYLFAPPADPIAPLTRDRFIAWTEASWTAAEAGFRNRLTVGGAPPLTAWRDAPVDGLKPPPVDTGAPAEVQEAVSRAVFGLVDFAVAYAWMGNVASASALSVVRGIAGAAITAGYAYGKRHLTGSAVALPGIGPETTLPQ